MTSSTLTMRAWRPLAALTFAILFAACGGGGGGGDGGGTDDDISLSMTTAGSATTVAPGASLTIRADVLNSTNKAVTWGLEGSACTTDCGSITPTGVGSAEYRAPATVPARFTVTVRATSVQNTAKSGTVALTVTATCPANLGLLNGSYGLLLQGFDLGSGKALAMVGSMTADGCGGITAGWLDFGPTPSGAAVAVTGSYTIGTDRRGTLTLGAGSSGKTFAIALGQVNGGVAERVGVAVSGPGTGTFASVWSGSGTAWRQDPNAFALGPIAGDYAYLLNGWTVAGVRKAIGGTVTLAASGSFISALQDENQFGVPVTVGRTWTGSAGVPSTSGGRSELSASAFGAAGRAVIYVVNGERALVLLVDGSGTLLSGSLARQREAFGATSVQGGVISWQTGSHTGVGYEHLTASVLSLFAADGASPQGTLSSRALDVNSGGNLASYPTPGAIVYTYSVASNGQVTVYNAGVAGGKYYLTSRNTGFLLGFDTGVSIGEVRPQVLSSPSLASLSGSYFASQAAGGASGSLVATGVATSPGNGFLGTIMDVGSGGSFVTRTDLIGGALTDTGNGRFTDVQGNVIYMLSGDAFLTLPLSGSEVYPVVQVFDR